MSLRINLDPLAFLIESSKFIDSSNISMRWEYDGGKIVCKASLPAVRMEDVKIDINDKVLTLTRELNIADGGTILRRFLKVSRNFDLPEGVKRSNFKSTSMEDGVLTVTFTRDAAATANTSSRSVYKKVIAFLNAVIYWETSLDKHVLKASLPPGMKKEDVKIEIEDDGTELKMIVLLETEEEEGDTIPEWLLEEFTDGKIIRRFKLPADVRLDDFKTAMEEDGVLTVTFTKPIKPKKTQQQQQKLISKLLGFLAKAAAAPFAKLNQKSKLLRVLSTKKLISKLGVLAKAAPVCILCGHARSNSGSSNNSNSQR
ncbi:hypothetical protein CICLE_v10005470mg [Citrus x clementina]|uniref:SHSP domain-containing protein n=1 Tax=Citrus clementina TaxID=85681 RepID=V4S257_CITCL|nr:hypothetical protein CICLE_v10005470mg [Citrus x clementina]